MLLSQTRKLLPDDKLGHRFGCFDIETSYESYNFLGVRHIYISIDDVVSC